MLGDMAVRIFGTTPIIYATSEGSGETAHKSSLGIYLQNMFCLICLLDLILYVPSTLFQL